MRYLQIFSFLVLVTPFATGCDILTGLLDQYDEPIDLPIDLKTPPQEIDVTTQVETIQDSLCATAESESCIILSALDKTDDDEVSDPPRIPDEFPAMITMEDDEGNALPDPECTETNPLDCDPWEIDVVAFLEDQALFEDLDFVQAVPVDLASQVEVSSADAIQEVKLESIGIDWQDNGLTFDSIPLELWMTAEYIEDPDAETLMADGSLTLVGTISAQTALTDGETEIVFANDDAKAAFNDALKSLLFTVVVAPAEGAKPVLADGEAANTKLSPKGIVNISLVATIVFTVTPEELVGDAKTAYEDGNIEDYASEL
jgi:hypothetical protein